MKLARLTGVLQEGVRSRVVLAVVVLRVPVLVPVADQRLRVVRVLVHCFCSGGFSGGVGRRRWQTKRLNK